MTQPAQQQDVPGTDQAMDPSPDYGVDSYRGSGRLEGKVALITGGDSGIGKAVALAFAREGADVAIAYLNEHEDAEEARRFVEDAGRRAILLPGDISDPQHCRDLVAHTVQQLGGLDVLVSNAAFQMSHDTLEEIEDSEWDYTWATNVSAYFHLVKAALPHLKEGADGAPRPARRARPRVRAARLRRGQLRLGRPRRRHRRQAHPLSRGGQPRGAQAAIAMTMTTSRATAACTQNRTAKM